MIPGALEAGVFTVNSLLGSWLTLRRGKDKLEAARWERQQKSQEMLIAATTTAREFGTAMPKGERKRTRKTVRKFGPWEWSCEKEQHDKGFIPRDGGLHSTRRIVIYIVIFTAFLSPVMAAFFGDGTSIAYGYPETIKGFFTADTSAIKWLVLGDGARTLFIPPYVSLMVSAISGLLFGNQMVK